MLHFSLRQREGAATFLTWAFLLALGLLAIFVATAASGVNFSQAWTLATTHQPERYSELYFEDPGHLPAYAPAGKLQVVYFHIVNHEHQSQHYQYSITRTIGGVTSELHGSVDARDGQDVRQALQFVIPKPLEQAKITVQLLNSNQQLTFRSQS